MQASFEFPIHFLKIYSNLAPLIVFVTGQRQINPALAANHIQVIKDTHGKTSQLSAADVEALVAYLLALE